MKLVIFSDMDGTLLDSKYSFRDAEKALDLIKKKKVPLILSSSKTRAELELYRKKMRNRHPFIVENGGAIFIPKNYFSSFMVVSHHCNRMLMFIGFKIKGNMVAFSFW